MNTSDNERLRAYHEAGHAALGVCLGVGCAGTALVGDSGCTNFIAECTPHAEDSQFKRHLKNNNCLRLAIAMYAGAAAARRAGYKNWRAGADVDHHEDDYHKAVEYINNITDATESIDCQCKLAHQRAVVHIEHHWPEIEAVAQALLKSKKLLEDDVARIVYESLDSRNAAPLVMEETKL